jgi:hypothetical protein
LKSGSLNLLEHSGPVQASREIVLPFTEDSAMADTSNFSIPALDITLGKYLITGGLWLLSDFQISVCVIIIHEGH